MQQFIDKNRDVITRYVKAVAPNCSLDGDDCDGVLEYWVWSDVSLLLWAIEEGVTVT